MKKAICPYEGAATTAARSGEWTDFLEKHFNDCPVCREVVETSLWMQALAQDTENHVDSRDASLIWLRAHLSERQTKVAKAQSVLEWTEIALGCAVSVALAAWVAWNWPVLQRVGDWLGAGLSPQTWIAAYATGASFWSFLSVLLLVVLFVVYPVLAEE